MADLVLQADTRTTMGKKNRALRAQGIIPIHVYGLKEAPLSLQAESRRLINVVREAGRTTPVIVESVAGNQDVTLVREVATHPVSGDVLHVDFLRVDVTQTVEAPVPVVLINQEEATGTRGGAGFVTQGVYEVVLAARPGSIPHELLADCSVLDSLDVAILASELPLPADAALASDPDERIAWIQPPRVIVEDEEEDEGLEGEEGEDEGDTSEDDEESTS
ncbi:MAG: 50S ribosomal protein L25 [Chloroflexi bacterium]|nr:50S ribosomal protein L25 [Chloroflexota bacterium]